MRRNRLFLTARPLAAALAAMLVVGCASAGAPEPPRASVHLDPAPTGPGASAPLPALPVAQIEDAPGSARRIEQLDVVDQELSTVIRGLAESYGLDYEIDPTIAGRVTTRLHDVTLGQALDALVLPHGYSYQIQGRVLRVVPTRMQTRIFTLDYISMTRAGFGTTVIQRRLGGMGLAGGQGAFGGQATFGGQGGAFPGGAFGGGGGDVIQSVAVADLWEEIRVSLEGLIFESTAGTGTSTTGVLPVQPATVSPTAGGGLGGGGFSPAGGTRAPGAYSRVGEDNRRLIVNPMSGTIVVSAPPEKLAEVEAFLTTLEASVHRQVLIEAKIVEVALNREFEFGIDWSFVQRVGNLALRLGGGQGGAQFTLDGATGDSERQIGVVLRALEEQGDVSVLLSPRVSALNNQRAVINASTDQVFFTVTRQPVIGPTGGVISFETQIVPQQVAVGITLDVLPQIAPDNTITMNVRPVITDVIAERRVQLPDGSQATAPVIDRRETDTVVRVRNGETIVIGGLMSTKQRNSRSGVPGLREVPLLGWLFGGSSREMEKRELVIFITPRIIAGELPAGN